MLAQVTSFGLRVFKKLSEGFAASSGSRWRPCHEGAALLATVARRRRIRLPASRFLALVESTSTPLDDLVGSRDEVSGWETVCVGGDPQGAVETGGVLVGLLPSKAEVDCERTWVAALINDRALTTFVSKIELAGIVELLHAAGLAADMPPLPAAASAPAVS